MNCLRPAITAAALALACACSAQTNSSNAPQLPSAESVMNRVAINQDTAEAERAHYVYVQHAKMTSRRGNTVMCEEMTDYRFTPSSDSSHEELLKVDGRFLKEHKYVTYTALLPRDEDKPKDSDKTRIRTSPKRKRRRKKIKIPPSTPTATKPSTAT